MLRRARLPAAVVILTISVVACGSDPRPTNAEWVPEWESMMAVVPDESLLGAPPNEQLCQDTLSALRLENEGLIPTPTSTIDDLVADWTAIAEAAFFECPPEGGSFTEAYDEMATIEDSIDTALTG